MVKLCREGYEPSTSRTGNNGCSFILLYSRKWVFDHAFPFLNRDNLIALQIAESGCYSAWPDDFELIYFRPLVQTKVQARVLRRLIAHSTFALIIENQVAGD